MRRSTDARYRQLTPGFRVKDQADACRSAGLAFTWCAPAWGKRELARWLVGPYARATEAASKAGVLRELAPVSRIQRKEITEAITEPTVRAIIHRAHSQVLTSLRSCQSWRDKPNFARKMIDVGLVVAVTDDEAALGYAPVSWQRMRLIDRVRSLFVADYLTRPDDYAKFHICEACDGATFDRYNEHGETCSTSPPSEFRRVPTSEVPSRRITLTGLGHVAA